MKVRAKFFNAVMREYLDSMPGEAERLSRELDIDSASVSGWKNRRKASAENIKKLALIVDASWRERVISAWMRDKTPEAVWAELERLRNTSAEVHDVSGQTNVVRTATLAYARLSSDAERAAFLTLLEKIEEEPWIVRGLVKQALRWLSEEREA